MGVPTGTTTTDPAGTSNGETAVPLGNVNSVLLEGDDGELVLIDAGFPDHESVVFDGLSTLGRRPEDLSHIVFTHAHPDHIGSAAAIVERAGAKTWMHPVDVPVSESGGPFRPMKPSPHLVQGILFRFFWRPDEPIAAVRIDQHIHDGEIGRASQLHLASLSFEAAAFGHGRAIPHDAMPRIRKSWG